MMDMYFRALVAYSGALTFAVGFLSYLVFYMYVELDAIDTAMKNTSAGLSERIAQHFKSVHFELTKSLHGIDAFIADGGMKNSKDIESIIKRVICLEERMVKLAKHNQSLVKDVRSVVDKTSITVDKMETVHARRKKPKAN